MLQLGNVFFLKAFLLEGMEYFDWVLEEVETKTTSACCRCLPNSAQTIPIFAAIVKYNKRPGLKKSKSFHSFGRVLIYRYTCFSPGFEVFFFSFSLGLDSTPLVWVLFHVLFSNPHLFPATRHTKLSKAARPDLWEVPLWHATEAQGLEQLIQYEESFKLFVWAVDFCHSRRGKQR